MEYQKCEVCDHNNFIYTFKCIKRIHICVDGVYEQFDEWVFDKETSCFKCGEIYEHSSKENNHAVKG